MGEGKKEKKEGGRGLEEREKRWIPDCKMSWKEGRERRTMRQREWTGVMKENLFFPLSLVRFDLCVFMRHPHT